MTRRSLNLIILMEIFILGCGGKSPTKTDSPDEISKEEVRLTAEDMAPQSELIRAEFATEVDHQRYRALGNIASAFEPKEKVIYFVGKIRNVPGLARIEVHWFRDAVSEPLLVSDVEGSETFSFIADFSPPREGFIPGSYTARVVVNDRDIGGASFTILGKDPLTQGPKVRKLRVSEKITKNHKPKNPKKKFRSKIATLHATFEVKNIVGGAFATVLWMRNENLFSEQNLELSSNGSFGADIRSPDGLPDGSYTVMVSLDGEPMAKTDFVVGKGSAGPSIDTLYLGLSLDDGNMPKKAMTSFATSAQAIFCGVRFLDMYPGSIITVSWNKIEDTEPSTYHTTQNHLPHGGSGTLGSMWEPNSGFAAGSYRVIILVDDEPMAEKDFSIR